MQRWALMLKGVGMITVQRPATTLELHCDCFQHSCSSLHFVTYYESNLSSRARIEMVKTRGFKESVQRLCCAVQMLPIWSKTKGSNLPICLRNER
ncbi:hypothetical protein OWV82_015218 [Melia azedarach]|uniref:Uncharacterized protein n=1 Tax=Melia azedarach TaxID=155640 RepID=A0ACC1XQR6_MELAZ|nr:hypothetical protein OWV82_015218 [Melia azedarach]